MSGGPNSGVLKTSQLLLRSCADLSPKRRPLWLRRRRFWKRPNSESLFATLLRLVLIGFRCVTGELDGKPSGSAVIVGRSPGPPNSSATSIWLRCDMQNYARFKNRPAYGSNPSGNGLELIKLAFFVLPEMPTSPVRFFNVRRYRRLHFSGHRASNLRRD